MAWPDVGGEIVVVFPDASPHARLGLAQGLRVQLVHIEARLHAVEELKRLEAAERDGADQLLEVLLTEAKKDIAKLHVGYIVPTEGPVRKLEFFSTIR